MGPHLHECRLAGLKTSGFRPLLVKMKPPSPITGSRSSISLKLRRSRPRHRSKSAIHAKRGRARAETSTLPRKTTKPVASSDESIEEFLRNYEWMERRCWVGSGSEIRRVRSSKLKPTDLVAGRRKQ